VEINSKIIKEEIENDVVRVILKSEDLGLKPRLLNFSAENV